MLISDGEFKSKYKPLYEQALQEAEYYVSNPAELKAEIELSEKERDCSKLCAPAPDLYPYRLMRYKGFVAFPDRLKNFIISEYEPRSATRSFLPPIMDVEPNSRCNFRCVMCQVSEWEKSKRADDLTFKEFKDYMDDQLNISEVKLHGMGDPLMNKEFFDMAQYLVERYIWVRTSINGSLLHVNDNYRRLIDAGMGEIQTSFDGTTKEVFEKIRRGSNFERVVKNYTMLNDYANRQGRLYTRMWVLVQNYNRHQIFEFVELAKQMGFRRLSFSITLNDWGQESWDTRNKSLQSKQGFSKEEKEQLLEIALNDGIDISIWEQADKYSTEVSDSLCPWPFNRPYISSEMRVVPCCMIGNPEVADLGDAKNFEKVWNDSDYQAFRQAHMDGDIPGFCRNCYKS